MKFFYTSINKFMWNHSFIKSCVHFASKFCPYVVAIFYSLFLLKIFLNKSGSMLVLTSEPIAVLIITVILRIIIDRKRPSEKYDLTPIDGSRKKGRSFPSIHVALSVSIALAVLHTVLIWVFCFQHLALEQLLSLDYYLVFITLLMSRLVL